jgi:F-type H+-transporting ATPase subunit epsilon
MADESLFNAQLVTPEQVLVNGVATEVILRTGEGDITFLAGSAPLVGTVEPGVVRVVDADGGVERIAVHGGFVQVEQHVDTADQAGSLPTDGPSATSGTQVTVLAGIAERAGEIDVDRARAAHDAAQALVAELAGAGSRAGAATGEGEEVDPDLVEAQAALLRAEVRLEAVDAAVPGAASTA